MNSVAIVLISYHPFQDVAILGNPLLSCLQTSQCKHFHGQ